MPDMTFMILDISLLDFLRGFFMWQSTDLVAASCPSPLQGILLGLFIVEIVGIAWYNFGLECITMQFGRRRESEQGR